MFDAKGVWNKLKPYMAMIFLQVGFAGMYVIVMVCLRQGMSHFALVVYRNIVAAAFMAPFALYFERKGRAKLTLPIVLKIVVLAILEPVIDQNFGYMGAKATSATFGAELFNIVPAVTFVLAFIFNVEKVKIKSLRGQAKVIGTIITVAGALTMILYKGPLVKFFWLKGRSHHFDDTANNPDQKHWIIGTLLIVTSCCSWAVFYILQANTLKSYPAPLSLTTLICFIGALLSGAAGLIFEHDFKNWRMGWDTRLFTCVYSGIFCSGLTYYIQGVVMRERGPVFVTAFNPLTMIVTAVLGSIILADEITLGMVIGAFFLVIGLYSLLWGKSQDKLANQSEGNGEKMDGELKLPIAATNVEIPEVNKP